VLDGSDERIPALPDPVDLPAAGCRRARAAAAERMESSGKTRFPATHPFENA
jgi:hypothetical protein